MKLFTPKETKDSKDAEITRDILRVQTVRQALKDSQKELDDINARFDIALANQRIRWATEEADAVRRIRELEDEIETLTAKKAGFVPIELSDSAYDNLEDIYKNKLDELSDREANLDFREQVLKVRETAVALERSSTNPSDLHSRLEKIN